MDMTNEKGNETPLEAGTAVKVAGYADGMKRAGTVTGHGYGKKTGALIYFVNVSKTVAYEGWSGGARPVLSTVQIKASAPFVEKA